GPVQILETEHGRPSLRKRLQKTPPGRIRLFLGGGLGRSTDERRETRSEPGSVVIVRRKRALELGRGLGGRVGLEDAALRLDDLSERPESDPLPIGQAAPLAPDDLGARLGVQKQLGAEAALADARFADDRHQLTGALLGGALEGAQQKRLLQFSPD